MISVGVRELKQQASELLRRVREGGETIEITYHGTPIARLVPVNPLEGRDLSAAWADLDQLTAEISTNWPVGVSAVDAVREQRREL